MSAGANYFTPTEAQRVRLNRAWAKYRRAITAIARGREPKENPARLQRELEETIAANVNGFASVEEART
jgi:hypothetical protein